MKKLRNYKNYEIIKIIIIILTISLISYTIYKIITMTSKLTTSTTTTTTTAVPTTTTTTTAVPTTTFIEPCKDIDKDCCKWKSLKCLEGKDNTSSQIWTTGLDASNNHSCTQHYPYPQHTRKYNTKDCTGPYKIILS